MSESKPAPVAWMWQTVEGTKLSLTEPADYEAAHHIEPLYARAPDLAAEVERLRAEFDNACDKLACALNANDALSRKVEALREALSSISVYGRDTLSGRADGVPTDKKWVREGVREMARRAEAALAATEGARKATEGGM